MLRRTTLGSLVLALLSATPGVGQVRLDHKYVEGATYTTETTAQLEQVLTIAGTRTESSADTRAVQKWTSGKRDAQGLLSLKETTESLQIKMSAQGSEYTFDSKMPDNKGTSVLEMLRDVHKAMIKNSTTTLIDGQNRIQSVVVDQNALGGLPVETQALVKGHLDPENLKKAAKQENDRLPSDPVNKGDNWLRTENVNLGAGQVLTFQTEYTYQGPITKEGKMLDRITSKALSVMFTIQDSPLPLAVKNSELKPQSEGEVLFDRARGRIVESRSSMRITGKMTLSINNMDLPSELDLKITSNVMER